MNYLTLLLLLGTPPFAFADRFDIFKQSDLRENQALIIEIQNVRVTKCDGCNMPITRVSYDWIALDAFLRVQENRTARGVTYDPVLEPYSNASKESYFEHETPYIPREGRYIGTLWQQCSQWGHSAADGNCRDWEIRFNLKERIQPL